MTASMHTEDLACHGGHNGHRYFIITGSGTVSGADVSPGMGIACPHGQESDDALATGLCEEVADEATLKERCRQYFLEHPEAMADIPFHRQDFGVDDEQITALRIELQRRLAELAGPTPEQLQERAHEFLERVLALSETTTPLLKVAADERDAATAVGFSDAFAEAHAAAVLSNLLSKAMHLGIVG